MATYHFQVRNPISRGKGQSAVAKAAYNARESLREERTGERKDYSRKHDEVLFSGIFVDPARKAPIWTLHREALWNAAVGKEKRKDAREAQEIIVGLPVELTDQQREYLIKDFVREHITRGTGRIADVNIHRPPAKGDDRNYHAHILMTLREMGPEGFGNRLPEMTPQDIVRLRTKLAERGAKELRKAGFEIEAERWAVGQKTIEEQRQAALQRGDFVYAAELQKEPTKHLGPGATAMERKGQQTERGDRERNDRAAQFELAKLERELTSVNRDIRVVVREQEKAQAPSAMRFGDRLLRQAALDALRDPRHEHGQPEWTGVAFRDALEKRRLALARITPEEAARSERERQFAKQIGRLAPSYKPGEIVVVQEPSSGDGTAPRVYKVDQERAEDYVRCLQFGKGSLQGLNATRQAANIRVSQKQSTKIRSASGPSRSGMAAQQAWALKQVQKGAAAQREQPRRPDDERAEKMKRDEYAEREKRDSGDQIDPERYRHDPDYRRQAQQAKAFKSADEKQLERESDVRAFIDRGGRE